MRGATRARTRTEVESHISTHAPREGRDQDDGDGERAEAEISTHAPREGRDVVYTVFHFVVHIISTHAPREGRDDSIKSF